MPATTENHYMYDELRCGNVPTQEEARTLLNDLKSGKAITHPICEPGYIERLEAIVAGRPVDPDYFRCADQELSGFKT